MPKQNNPITLKPFFSIVIPTLEEENYLPLLLDDLEKQTHGYQNYEIIHVDGGSKDKTIQIAKNYIQKFAKKNLLMQSISVNKKNVSTQRNEGAKMAKGEWVLFMDADNRLDEYFLDGIKYNLAKNPSCEAFTTWIKSYEQSQMNDVIVKTINFSTEFYYLIGKPGGLGAFIGVKKNILKKIKFDETQKVYEDTLFVSNISNSGHQFVIFRDPKFYYSLRRMKKEGTLVIAAKGALMSLHYLQGKDFKNKTFGYEMEGGNAYSTNTPSLIKDFPEFLKTASKKQLNQAKKLLKNLKELQI